MIFTKNREGVQANRATKYAPLVRKYTNRIVVKRWHNKYKILNYIERHNFGLNDFLTKFNRTAFQIYGVQERTFGEPCIFAYIFQIW